MDQIKVAMEPFQSSKNTYIHMLKSNMDSDIEMVPLPGLKECVKGKLDFQAVHLNWFEKIDGDTKIQMFQSWLKKTWKLSSLKKKGVKIIATVHNRFPHDCQCPGLTTKLIRKISKTADALTILCDESYEAIHTMVGDELYAEIRPKIEKISHPNYLGVYRETQDDIRSRLGIPKDSFVFLFFGAVKPYKNVELVIETARHFENENVYFIIAGGTSGKGYKEEIESQAESCGNVKTMLEFISDDMIVPLIHASNILVLPYDLKSSLNSGTCVLSFSLKKNVICPRIGTIKELKNQVCYDYTYSSENEHLERLLEKSRAAYHDFVSDRESFENKANLLYDEMIRDNDARVIGRKYSTLYKNLVCRD